MATIEVAVPKRPQMNGFTLEISASRRGHGDGGSAVEPIRRSTRPRQITVDEALQYTPITTSLLPAHDRIPIPQLGRSSQSRLTTAAERQAAYRAEHVSSAVKERLATLLDPSRLSEYKFKRSPAQVKNTAPSDLGPLPMMVYKDRRIDHIFSSSKSRRGALDKKAAAQVTQTPSRGQKSSIVVEIPHPAPTFPRQEFSTMVPSPKRHKPSESQEAAVNSLVMSSKREKDNRVLKTLEDQLLQVFEAQDRLTADTSGAQAFRDRTLFDILGDEGDAEPTLSLKANEMLQGTLDRLVTSGRLTDASPEYIRRLQLLCQPSIELSQTVNVRCPSSPSDDELITWLTNLHKLQVGAAAACTFIYTVLGNPKSQELVDLEILQFLPAILINIFEHGIIPVVEARPEGQDSEIFTTASANREVIRSLLDMGRKLLDLVARVCVEIKGAGSIVNSTEFLAAKLVFVQNPINDKQSALGSQVFERLRKSAMAVLAKLYATFPAERQAMLDEVLSSLDKLPSNSRSARQYKLGNGKNIQLVSALFMLLVQTLAIPTAQAQHRRRQRATKHPSDDSDNSDSDLPGVSAEQDPSVLSDFDADDTLTRVAQKADRLIVDASSSAQHIVVFMVDKASKVTKTGDSPYRNILDLFIEDLTVVLTSTDWPAAELLLTILAHRMITLAKNDKSASTKNMALESLGVMGSAISSLQATAKSLAMTVQREGESEHSAVGQGLTELVQDRPHFHLQNSELISPAGPLSIIHSHLGSKIGEGLRMRSAKAFLLVLYAARIGQTLKSTADVDESMLKPAVARDIAMNLRQLSHPEELHKGAENDLEVTGHEAQFAYMLGLLNMSFCRRFTSIVKTIASSLSSDQAQVRSRSLKSVVNILETDSSLLDLDPTIADDVFKCASDDSAMVRDSALSLIAKFIIPRPALEMKAFKRLLECAADANVSVQKRSLGHLKDIYLRENRANIKVIVAKEFLRCTTDTESAVAELAKKTLSEIWIVPYLNLLTNCGESAQTDVAIDSLKQEIISCIAFDTVTFAPPLKQFLAWNIKDAKESSQLQELYTRIVKKLLDAANSTNAGSADLTTLVAFAEARPQTVAPADLASLKSYLKDISKADDLLKFKSVVSIFRIVLPHLSSTQAPLLDEVLRDLLQASTKVGRRQDLEEVMSCLNSINGVLQNSNRLSVFTSSIVQRFLRPELPAQVRDQLQKAGRSSEIEARENRTRESSLRLAGTAAKHINLENFKAQFQKVIPAFRQGSVTGFLVDEIEKFTGRETPLDIRLQALESLGLICQAWPGQLSKRLVRDAFFRVLDGTASGGLNDTDVLKLQIKVLELFEELYSARAAAKSDTNDKVEEKTPVQELKIIGGDDKARQDTSAMATVTGLFVDPLLKIILSETGEKAFLAAKTLASIDHQGMTHPKQTTAAFVALETNPDLRVANVARLAHAHLHSQHESVCEREYFHAVQAAFQYQNKVFGDPRGGIVPGYKAKLAAAFGIISDSGSKAVKKFISNVVSKISSEISKLSNGLENADDQLLFILFVAQNIAFFEYKKMDELLHTVLQLELAFGKSSAETVQAIETNIHLEPTLKTEEDVNGETMLTAPDSSAGMADLDVLKRLTRTACAISLVSEARNFLKRQYGVSRDVKSAMQQNKQTKDATKEPVKVHGITGDRFWTTTNLITQSLSSPGAMVERCREFIKLVAIDDEVKVAEEEADLFATLVDAEQPQPRGKKRKSVTGSVGGTPKKPRGRPPKNPSTRRSTSISSMDDPDADFSG